MSTEDIKIQTSSPDELAGGQQSLQPDRTSTHGHNQDVVFRGFPPSPNVKGREASLCSPAQNNREAASVSGMAVGAPTSPTVKHVDQKNVGQGGYPGDTRKQGAPAVMPANPGPREGMGQFPNSGRTPASSTPASFPGNLADSDSGN